MSTAAPLLATLKKQPRFRTRQADGVVQRIDLFLP
jgi:hypothetical protein